MAGKDLTKTEGPPAPTVVEVAAGIVPRDGDIIGKYLRIETKDDEVAAEVTHTQIIEEILAAQTVSEILEVLDPEKWDPFVGRHIRLLGYKHIDSEYETGPPVYFVVKLFDCETDTKHLVVTGEQAVMAQLMKLQAINAFPVDVIPKIPNKPNKYGKYLVRLAEWTAPSE